MLPTRKTEIEGCLEGEGTKWIPGHAMCSTRVNQTPETEGVTVSELSILFDSVSTEKAT